MDYQKKVNHGMRILYQMTLLFLLLNLIDNVPGVEILRKIKYVYLIGLFFYMLQTFHFWIRKRTVYLILIFGILIVHTILFGVVFINPAVASLSYKHLREMMILLFFIIGTMYLYGMLEENAVLRFGIDSYRVFCIFLLWAGITHAYNFTNPTKFIYTLLGDHSYRGAFGMNHANYLGSICCCALICSMFIIDYYRKRGSILEALHVKKILACVVMDFYIGEILFSTSSRTAVLTVLFVILVYCWLYSGELIKYLKNKQFLIIALGILVIVLALSSGIVQTLLQNTRRENAWLINYPIFSNYFNRIFGMGYINYSGFSYGNGAYGYNTWNVDNYYLYILFSTGYLGIAMIGTSLFISLLAIIKSTIKTRNVCGLCTIISLLMLGIAQTSVLSYDHIICVVFWVLIGLCISVGFTVKGE